MSLDGKISTGDNDTMDVDKDLPTLEHIKDGLHQYYEQEKTTDLYSFNTGRVFAKIGLNEKKGLLDFVPVYFVLADNKPHLTQEAIEHLLKKCKGVILLTTNKQHPAAGIDSKNLTIHQYDDAIDFADAFAKLKATGAEAMTIQSGGTLNATLMRAGLIDHVRVVVAPAVIGGKDTATLVDGESLHDASELSSIKALTFRGCDILDDSYIQLRYDVIL